ncbi:hypothetical protein [Flavobacterium sp.]|uniref:hypothetical protein n=1 Tax=Flavobacterium sp. TaxID=239 RepID=UPI0039E4C625
MGKSFFDTFFFRLILCLLFILMVSYSIKAQPHEHDEAFLCSYYGESINPKITLAPAEAGAEKVIEKILAVVGLRPNFEVRAANVPNAAAVILKNKRYILYNPKFIAKINYAADNDWAGISIIAHEIGHHLNGHTLQSGGSRPNLELEADEFSGFVLNKLGANKADAQAAMNVAASQKSSHTHPARKDRLMAISDGWNNASGQTQPVAVHKTAPISKPAMVQIPAPASRNDTALDESHIAFDVFFDGDESGQYFITTQGNLVTVEDDSVYTIGRLSESNRRGYKLMLSDKHYNYLYIAQKGEIVNRNGQSVGYIDTHD